MSKNDFCELWLADSRRIQEYMAENKTSTHSLRDYFLEKVLQRYISDFSLADLTKSLHGKPVLKSAGLSFNLSHSDDYFALLVCDQKFCGADIQGNKKRDKFDDALKSVLTDREMIMLRNSDDREYFRLWSVKEAYIKAIGSSIWFGRDYDFSGILPDYSDEWQGINEYFLYSTEVYSDTFLSLVIPEKPRKLILRKF